MQKRILSFILCAVLICGLFPTTAMAMDSQAEYQYPFLYGCSDGQRMGRACDAVG